MAGRFFGAICCILLCGMAQGGEAPRLDLATAQRLALERDPRLAARRADIETARRKADAAIEWRNPELRGEYADYRSPADPLKPLDPDGTWNKNSVGLRLFPPTVWTFSALRDAAMAGVRSAECALAMEELEVVRDVREAFFEALSVGELLDAFEPLYELVVEQRATLHEREDRQEATSVDAATIDLDYLEMTAEYDNLRRQLAFAKDRLAGLMGEPGPDAWTLPEKHELPNVDLDRLRKADLCERAFAHRRDVGLLREERAELEADRRVERSRRWPSLAHIEGGYSWENGDQEDTSWRVQAAVELPVFTLADRRRERALTAEMAGCDARMAAVQNQAAREVREALAALTAADEHWRRFQREAEPLIENMQATMRTTRDASGVDWATHRHFKEKSLRAMRLLIESRQQYLAAIHRLEDVVGMDIAAMQADAPAAILEPVAAPPPSRMEDDELNAPVFRK